jgi:hypothetical protein
MDLGTDGSWVTVMEIPLDGTSVTVDRAQLPAGAGFLRAWIKSGF